MSNTIDERVVQMRFDNQDFERRAGETIGTLDKLKSALSFKKSSESLNELQTTANRFNMNGFAEAIEGIQNRFSALGTFGARIVERLADNIYNKVYAIGKSMTMIDQLGAGWEKYAQKTSSVQTIMAATRKEFDNTDEQMEVVNAQLEKLNWFTDETSYSFLDMVNNIGKFTSNNVKLETAVTAMEGISTWAAVSGANIGEAGRAMYNLSQAMAVGSVKLMDWKSIENANMATAEFKETAIETAIALGTLRKGSDGVARTLKGTEVSVTSFNQTLSEAWFTSDVLLKTLDKYGGFANELNKVSDATGLTATRLLQATDKFKKGGQEAEEVVLDLSHTTGVSTEEIRGYLEKLGDDTYDLGRRAFAAAQEAKTFQEAIDSVKDAVSTGWMNTFELIFGDYNTAKKVWTTLANELYDVFMAGTEFRNGMLSVWADLGGRESLFAGISNIWSNITAILERAREAIHGIFLPFDANDAGQMLKDLSDKFAEFTEKLIISDETMDKISVVLKGIASPIRFIIEAIKTAFKILSPLAKVIKTVSGHIIDLFSSIAGVSNDVSSAFDKFGIFGRIADKLTPIIDKLADRIVKLVDGIANFVKSLGFTDLLKNISSGIKEAFFLDLDPSNFGILKSVKGIKDSITNIFGTDTGTGFFKPIVKYSDAVRALKGDFKDLNGALTDTGTGLEKVNSESSKSSGFVKFLVTIRDLFSKLKDLFSKFDLSKILDGIGTAFSKLADIFRNKINIVEKVKSVLDGLFEILGFIVGKIVKAVESVVNAFKGAEKAGAVDFLDLIKNAMSLLLGGGIISALGSFSTASKSFGETLESIGEAVNKFRKKKGVISLLMLGGAIALLALSVTMLASIDTKKLVASIGAMAGIFEMVIIFSQNAKKLNVKGIFSLAAAMLVLSAAIKVLSTIDTGSLFVSLGAMALLMAMTSVFANSLGTIKKKIPSLISMAAGILVLSAALKVISSIDSNRLLASLGAMAAMFVMVGTLSVVADGKKTKGLIKMASGILLLSAALKVISSIDSKSLLSSIGAMAALFALVAVLSVVADGKKVKGMVSLAAGMLLLSESLKVISKIDPARLGVSVAAMGVLMAMVAAFSVTMNGAGVSGAAAMLLFASSTVVLATALMAFSLISWESIAKGLVALAGLAIIAETVSLVMGPTVGVFVAFAAGVALIGVGLAALGVGLTTINVALITFAGSAVSVAAAFIGVLDVIIFGLIDFISGFLDHLGQFAVSIVTIVATVIGSVLDALIKLVPKIIDLGITLLLALLDGIYANEVRISNTAISIILLFIDTIASRMGDIVQSGINLIVSFINGIADGLDNNKDTIWNAIHNLWNSIKEFLLSALPEGARDSIREFLNAIEGFFSDLITKGTEIVSKIIEGIKQKWEDLKEMGANIVNGVKQGIENAWEKIKGVGSWIGQKVTEGAKSFLGIHSPSKLFAEIGGYTVDGFALGIKEAGYKATEAIEDVGEDSKDSFENALKQIDFDADPSLNPVITPVLDLTDVKDGAKGIGDILGNKQALKVSSDITSSENRRASFHDGQASTVGSNTTTNNGDFIFNIYSDSTMDVNDIASAVEQRIKTTFERKRFATL